MDEQPQDFLVERHICFVGLPLSGFHTDDHVAQMIGIAGNGISVAGKRKNIRRHVFFAEIAVEFTDFPVRHENERYPVGILTCQDV